MTTSAFYRDPEISMRPVFARLSELEIPAEANIDEPQVSDMTLIHELDDMIQHGFDSDEAEAGAIKESSGAPADEPSERELVGFTTKSGDLGVGQVEALLAKLGGVAPLATSLRDFARAKGFQRLGRNVRKELEAELEMLARLGKVTIKGGEIRLL